MQIKNEFVGSLLSLLAVVLFGVSLFGFLSDFFYVLCFMYLLFCIVSIFLPALTFISRIKLNLFHVAVFVLIIFTTMSHLIQVALPETSFDALWYHLPTVQEYVMKGTLLYDTTWYQTLYPQYGDLFFVIGFGLAGVLGAKLIAFVFFLFLLHIVFLLFNLKLKPPQSLLGVLTVALFQVVSWQSSAVYVDLLSTVFFLWSVYSLIRFQMTQRQVFLIQSALCSGVFFGVKFINLGFFPLMILVSLALLFKLKQQDNHGRFLQHVLFFWVTTVVVALPWYLRSWWYSGSLMYPIGTSYAQPVIQQMGVSGWHEWLTFRFSKIWKLPWEFFLHSDGYTTYFPILLVAPFALIRRKWNAQLALGIGVGIYGLLFWYFFPPPSTRYILGPLIFLWITLYSEVFQRQQRKRLQTCLLAVLVVLAIAHITLRIFINTRGLAFIFGWETEQQYLDRFRNGFLDEKIDGFYGKE